MGEVYFIVLTTCFKMIMSFFIIAILATTYKLFEARSNGLVLTKILQTRDEMSYDYSYGCFLTHFPPFNILLFLAIPFGLLLRYRHPLLVTMNMVINRSQYILVMLFAFAFYLIVSFLLLPLAYLKCCFIKFNSLKSQIPFAK